jgi:polyhydroxyalkanoate synthesis repressor PhaR
MKASASASGPRLIRRYENRKLYDTARRRYVTLEELARLVGSGEDVHVEDQRTGEDLTAMVLAQVILEGIKERTTRIPGQVLARLIRLGFGPDGKRAQWPDPGRAAAKARQEAERIVAALHPALSNLRERLMSLETRPAAPAPPARPPRPKKTRTTDKEKK